jgi:hypothetical protein
MATGQWNVKPTKGVVSERKFNISKRDVLFLYYLDERNYMLNVVNKQYILTLYIGYRPPLWSSG